MNDETLNSQANSLDKYNDESVGLEGFSYDDMTFSGISWDDEYDEIGEDSNISQYARSSISINSHAESETLGTLKGLISLGHFSTLIAKGDFLAVAFTLIFLVVCRGTQVSLAV